jgi:hypothetical protein
VPTPRRRPWGQLWAAAPWDGKARPPAPVRMPNTDAALIDTPPPAGGSGRLRRLAFGRLLAAAPWTGLARDLGRVSMALPPTDPNDTAVLNPHPRRETPE